MVAKTWNNPVVAWIDDRLPIFSVMHAELVDYPTPKNLNYWWNFGSLNGIVLVIMIATGIVILHRFVAELGHRAVVVFQFSVRWSSPGPVTDTCQFPHLWNPDVPETGQCGTTAMVVMDILGGELLEAEVAVDGERIEYHYWTRLPNGDEVDLTRGQFGADGDRRIIGEPYVRERPESLKPEFQALYDTMLARVLAFDSADRPAI